MAQSPTSAQRMLGVERRREAVRLRIQGYNYREIGAKLGISAVAAHRHVTKALAAENAKIAEMVPEATRLEINRLDMLQAALAEKVKAGDVRAVEATGRLLERRSRLLGLDAPARSEVNIGLSNLSDREVEEEARRLGLLEEKGRE